MIYRAIGKAAAAAWVAIVTGVIWWIASFREPLNDDDWEDLQW